eukprot:2869486-Pyramimonas_sp.AAC.1
MSELPGSSNVLYLSSHMRAPWGLKYRPSNGALTCYVRAQWELPRSSNMSFAGALTWLVRAPTEL